ncbi:MAG: replication-relaxation family protein [Verrucomicrobiae bacterium]|nr:replication-relaxation family protein [Verrucomicrobiae bacterium]
MDGAFNRPSPLAALTERDRFWLAFLHRHGPLPSHLLYEATKATHRCKDTALRRLQHLRETGWLCLPQQQFRLPKPDFNPYVYDLTPRALQLLATQGAPDHLRPTGHWLHLTGVAATTARIEIATTTRGDAFIPAATILTLKGAPVAIPLARSKLIPDAVFAIRRPEGYRAYLLEYDRGTEPLVSPSFRKSLTRNLEAYDEAFTHDRARQHYGLKAPLRVIWVFGSEARERAFTAMVGETPTRQQRHELLRNLAV